MIKRYWFLPTLPTLKYLSENLPGYLLKGKNVEFALGSKSEIEDYAKRFAPVSKTQNQARRKGD